MAHFTGNKTSSSSITPMSTFEIEDIGKMAGGCILVD